ncbi:MAG: ribonuclease III [Methanoregulaceae archaeon]|jgi:ribonuclease-3|nr:ribonuclease III [Methanoregulaceae archaeon]
MNDERKTALRAFLKKLGRTRVPAGMLELYHQALTHSSYGRQSGGREGDNERLEFLGDRVLNFILAEHLYRTFPDAEGELTARMEFVRNMNLARYVVSSGSGLTNLILVGKGQDMNSRIVAGAFEAFIAALYLDTGLAKTQEVIFRFFPPKTTRFGAAKNYKKELQEQVQKAGLPPPIYKPESREGEDHQPQFVYVVLIDGVVTGRGTGMNKADATRAAARQALEVIRQRGSPV